MFAKNLDGFSHLKLYWLWKSVFIFILFFIFSSKILQSVKNLLDEKWERFNQNQEFDSKLDWKLITDKMFGLWLLYDRCWMEDGRVVRKMWGCSRCMAIRRQTLFWTSKIERRKQEKKQYLCIIWRDNFISHGVWIAPVVQILITLFLF